MFTQNYMNYQKGVFMGADYVVTTANGTATTITGGLSVSLAGLGYALARGICRSISGAGNSPSDVSGVCFGTDPTPPTKNDITLPGLIAYGLTIESMGSLVGKVAEGIYAAWGSYTVKNTSTTLKNIYEIGIFVSLRSSASSGNYLPVLMERTVLPEPISLQPGEETIITHKITFNQTLSVD